MKVDCVRMIEAAYGATVESEQAWLRDILEPFEPLSLGLGVLATSWDFSRTAPQPLEVRGSTVSPDAAAALERMHAFLAREHPAAMRAMLGRPGPSVVCWLSRVGSDFFPLTVRAQNRAFFAGSGIGDTLAFVVAEPSGPSVVISLPAPKKVAIPPRTVQQLERVTAHLCTAVRLRARLRAAGESGAEVDAVLDPGGKVCDASPEAATATARASLTAAVRSVERARGSLRRTDPEEALSIWRALFDGRWSIVERTESDGKRFLLARRNSPDFKDPKALAPGERDVLAYAAQGFSNKYIGYLLGVATSTVASRLASGLHKLSVASRREAIELLGGGEASPAGTIERGEAAAPPS